MAKIKWTPTQLAIDDLLDEGKTKPEIMGQLGCGASTVQKVITARHQGWKPTKSKEKKGEEAPTPKEKPKPIAKVLTLKGTVISSEYTPIMQMAQVAASEEWNWDPDIRFEDFIDTILYHFFKDRGITLQGYIVDKEVEAK